MGVGEGKCEKCFHKHLARGERQWVVVGGTWNGNVFFYNMMGKSRSVGTSEMSSTNSVKVSALRWLSLRGGVVTMRKSQSYRTNWISICSQVRLGIRRARGFIYSGLFSYFDMDIERTCLGWSDDCFLWRSSHDEARLTDCQLWYIRSKQTLSTFMKRSQRQRISAPLVCPFPYDWRSSTHLVSAVRKSLT